MTVLLNIDGSIDLLPGGHLLQDLVPVGVDFFECISDGGISKLGRTSNFFVILLPLSLDLGCHIHCNPSDGEGASSSQVLVFSNSLSNFFSNILNLSIQRQSVTDLRDTFTWLQVGVQVRADLPQY